MLSRLLTGVCAVAGSLAGAQFPAFYTQYLQHVSGRLTQVLRDLRTVLQDAQARGLSVETYLERAAQESGSYTRRMVESDMRAYADLRELEQAYSALSDAGATMQPVAFVRHLNVADIEAVFRHYTPALPISTEGLAYGGAGLILGLSLAWVLESPLRVWHDARRKRRRRRKQGSAAGGRSTPAEHDTAETA
jgi:hypothetical protein